jgi:tungstate transport system permease protein
MEELWRAVVKAFELIVSLDAEVIDITGRSLLISATSCIIACAVCFPLAGIIHFSSFPGKRLFISVVQTLYSLPTVLVGLFIFVLLSRSGPLGGLGLLFTPLAMVMGQAIFLCPIVLGLGISALRAVDTAIYDVAMALGANRVQATLQVMKESRYALAMTAMMGFGRAISEVGLSLMVGGNIKGFTRTLTTAISLETSRGNLEFAIALGIILLLLALMVNMIVGWLQQR